MTERLLNEATLKFTAFFRSVCLAPPVGHKCYVGTYLILRAAVILLGLNKRLNKTP